MKTVFETAQTLLSWDYILVVSHASPDGDTLGAATALIRGLRSLGKKADFACADDIDKKYRYLFDGIDNINFIPERVVTVDVADSNLLGSLDGKYEIDFAIDHHALRVSGAGSCWVDAKAAATCQMIYKLLLEMKVKITKEIANCLYTGISTDTGCFKYSNATSDSYRVAAQLIDAGARSGHINRIMFDTKTRACIEVERRVFASMEFLFDDKIVCATIPRALLLETGAKESDLDGIPSMVRGIEGVFVGITLKEKEDGIWKASVRAINPVNAAEICRELGGGGHKGAGGCTLGTDLQAGKKKLIDACEKALS